MIIIFVCCCRWLSLLVLSKAFLLPILTRWVEWKGGRVEGRKEMQSFHWDYLINSIEYSPTRHPLVFLFVWMCVCVCADRHLPLMFITANIDFASLFILSALKPLPFFLTTCASDSRYNLLPSLPLFDSQRFTMRTKIWNLNCCVFMLQIGLPFYFTHCKRIVHTLLLCLYLFIYLSICLSVCLTVPLQAKALFLSPFRSVCSLLNCASR